jgi:putative ABC transport system substrate-binding protein
MVSIVFFSLCFSAEAQQPTKIPRIGFLSLGSFNVQSPRQKAIHQKLSELGYIEGKNLVVEYRNADGDVNRLPELAEELLRRDVSIIITTSTSTLLAASKASRKIPIVAATSGDLEGTGLVASLARPGGYVTGLTALSPELSGKRLELLREIAPKIVRVAVVWNPSKWDEKEVNQTQVAAQYWV